MAADGDQQALAVAGSFIAGARLESHVVAQRTTLKNVIPGGDGERGNLNLVVVLLDGPLLPVTVISGMIEPIEEVGRQRAGEGRTVLSRSDIEDRKVLQRQTVIADDGICCLLHLAAVGILGEPRDPGLVEPLLECAALVS